LTEEMVRKKAALAEVEPPRSSYCISLLSTRRPQISVYVSLDLVHVLDADLKVDTQFLRELGKVLRTVGHGLIAQFWTGP
jgi:hypothetical protein